MSGSPLCIDLYHGLGGWAEGFVRAGWRVVGFDITDMYRETGTERGPVELVIQDVLTLHGSQFKNANVIVASPPCQSYSWLSMPWSRSPNPDNSKQAKALRAKWETEGPDNRLFDACFRIQREAIEASGRYIPLIVENVRGAQEWVGRSVWHHGSFHFWGDVPALMPVRVNTGTKVGGDWFRDPACHSAHGSQSKARKAAAARIAKIPLELSAHIAEVYGQYQDRGTRPHDKYPIP